MTTNAMARAQELRLCLRNSMHVRCTCAGGNGYEVPFFYYYVPSILHVLSENGAGRHIGMHLSAQLCRMMQ